MAITNLHTVNQILENRRYNVKPSFYRDCQIAFFADQKDIISGAAKLRGYQEALDLVYLNIDKALFPSRFDIDLGGRDRMHSIFWEEIRRVDHNRDSVGQKVLDLSLPILQRSIEQIAPENQYQKDYLKPYLHENTTLKASEVFEYSKARENTIDILDGTLWYECHSDVDDSYSFGWFTKEGGLRDCALVYSGVNINQDRINYAWHSNSISISDLKTRLEDAGEFKGLRYSYRIDFERPNCCIFNPGGWGYLLFAERGNILLPAKGWFSDQENGSYTHIESNHKMYSIKKQDTVEVLSTLKKFLVDDKVIELGLKMAGVADSWKASKQVPEDYVIV